MCARTSALHAQPSRSASAAILLVSQFACFTSTKVQILTRRAAQPSRSTSAAISWSSRTSPTRCRRSAARSASGCESIRRQTPTQSMLYASTTVGGSRRWALALEVYMHIYINIHTYIIYIYIYIYMYVSYTFLYISYTFIIYIYNIHISMYMYVCMYIYIY
jgi:hypothetical protein